MNTRSLKLLFSKKMYSIEVLKKASYKYSARFSNIISEKDEEYICDISFPEKTSETHINFCIDDFKKEVADQDLRRIVSKETEHVRNLILAHAFSKTSVIENE